MREGLCAHADLPQRRRARHRGGVAGRALCGAREAAHERGFGCVSPRHESGQAEAAAHHEARRQRRAQRLRIHPRQQATRLLHERARRIHAGLDVRHRERQALAADPGRLGCLVRDVFGIGPLSRLGYERRRAHGHPDPGRHKRQGSDAARIAPGRSRADSFLAR